MDDRLKNALTAFAALGVMLMFLVTYGPDDVARWFDPTCGQSLPSPPETER